MAGSPIEFTRGARALPPGPLRRRMGRVHRSAVHQRWLQQRTAPTRPPFLSPHFRLGPITRAWPHPISSSTFLSTIHLSVNPSNTASRALPFIISYTLHCSRQDGCPARNITRQIGIPPAPKPISAHHPFLISSAGTFPRPVHSNKHAALSSHSPDPHPRLDTAHPFRRPVQQKLERRLLIPQLQAPVRPFNIM